MLLLDLPRRAPAELSTHPLFAHPSNFGGRLRNLDQDPAVISLKQPTISSPQVPAETSIANERIMVLRAAVPCSSQSHGGDPFDTSLIPILHPPIHKSTNKVLTNPSSRARFL